MSRQNIPYIISAFLFLCIAYLFYRVESQQRLLEQGFYQKEQPRSKKDRREDPYVNQAVKNTIRKNAADMQSCYNQFMERNKDVMEKAKPEKTGGEATKAKFAGKVELDWQIDRDGEVVKPEVIYSEMPEKPFLACLREKIQAWKFPQPDRPGKVYIQHSFHFQEQEK